jgi:hypothetical protein
MAVLAVVVIVPIVAVVVPRVVVTVTVRELRLVGVSP